MVARPYVIVNVAASVDGKIDTFERRGAAISSERDRVRVDALRASVDAVMIGGHTLVDEDPRLTVKSAELRAARVARGVAENPAKVAVISSVGLLKPNGRFVTEGQARVIVFTPQVIAGKWPSPDGVEIFAMGNGRVDLRAAMTTLHDEGMSRVLVEGGGTLNFELLRLGLVDEVHLYVAPMIFGGNNAPTLADGGGMLRTEAIKLVQNGVDVDDDGGVLLRYKVEPRE
jgi:2,5-diamino-6-(ribosylamino)-4(3H)-pyrimidinone 5'-phosphate reductase